MKRLTEKELAARWDMTSRTLRDWRATWEDADVRDKLGPPFLRIGPRSIIYREEDVLSYEAARVVGSVPAPLGWDVTVKRAAGTLDILAGQAKSAKARAALHAMRDELRGLILP